MNEPTESQSCPIALGDLPPAILRNVGEKAPTPLKLMTARGMAPMPPKDLVTAQFILTFDTDEKVRDSAAKSLASLEPRLANAVLGDTQLHPEVLAHLAKTLATNDAYAEKILLNPKTPSHAFVDAALTASEQICELIANNQARILDEPEIARSLTKNPNALKSSIDRVIDFLVRSGVVLEDLHHFEEAFLRLNGNDRLKIAEAQELPSHLVDEQFLSDEEKNQRRLIEEDEEEAQEEEKTRNIEAIIRDMSIGQKIALATKGNRTARTLLMRDTNRLVAVAAITSPAVNETEVLAAAASRTVNADVIAHICRDKKNNWIRLYQVKVALVNNPKTPMGDALKYVTSLNGRDMKAVAKSRNVPAGVRNRATQIIKGRAK